MRAQDGSDVGPDVEADALTAGKRRQIPAVADAEFDDPVTGAHVRRELPGAEARDPWKSGIGNRESTLVIGAAGIAHIALSDRERRVALAGGSGIGGHGLLPATVPAKREPVKGGSGRRVYQERAPSPRPCSMPRRTIEPMKTATDLP